jgi:hypothetical protein
MSADDKSDLQLVEELLAGCQEPGDEALRLCLSALSLCRRLEVDPRLIAASFVTALATVLAELPDDATDGVVAALPGLVDDVRRDDGRLDRGGVPS